MCYSRLYFGLRCRCSDTFAPFLMEKRGGVVAFGYPTATQKQRNALFMGVSRA